MASRAADGDRLGVAGFVLGLADSLDQHLQGLAYECLILAQRDCLLRFHDRVASFIGDLGRNR